MNFKWLLLAFFLVAVIWGTVKSLKKGMWESLLKLSTVVVAFLLALILQAAGLPNMIASAITGAIGLSIGVDGVEPLVTALLGTVVGAVLFVLLFLLFLLLLRVLVLRFVRKLFFKRGKMKAKEKSALYPEKMWQRAISAGTGVVGGILILGVLLLPVFYAMGLVTTAVHATEGLDAEDSRVYKTVAVLDAYVADPYESSFVAGFYDAVGISDLMNSTARLGGKMTLDDDSVVYADDTAKNLIAHGVSAAAQITSGKSACATVREDIDALIADPAISVILSDVLADYLGGLEMEPPAEDDLKSGIVYNFVQHYREAEHDAVAAELPDFANAVSLLAEKRVLPRLLGENANFEKVLRDEEALDTIVEAISELSAFGPTIEGAFELSVDVMSDTLKIPHDQEEAYDHFIDDLLTKTQRSTDVGFDINVIRYYIVNCEKQNKKVSSANGIKGHGQFMEYVAQWEQVQEAFATASEDRSYGYFTIEINAKWYIYDKTNKHILIYNEQTEAAYKDKISPVAGLINALTLRSTQDLMTRDHLYAMLSAYVDAANDPVSVALAERMLSKEAFAASAVTAENMREAENFAGWTDAEKRSDGKLCVDIILNLMQLMDDLEASKELEGTDAALDMLDEFKLLGETMDTMKETTCLHDLPPLLIEGIVKNELFAGYMKPSAAFQINNIVANTDKTYTDCMIQIADVLEWAIHSFGDLTEESK